MVLQGALVFISKQDTACTATFSFSFFFSFLFSLSCSPGDVAPARVRAPYHIIKYHKVLKVLST